MPRHLLLAIAALLPARGCANLVVHKVSGKEGKDNTKGFRYYLSRPYVLVSEPILVSEERGLYVAKSDLSVPKRMEEIPPPAAAVKQAGERGELARFDPSTKAVTPVSDEEWQALKKAMLDQPEVVQTLFRRNSASQPLTVNVQAAAENTDLAAVSDTALARSQQQVAEAQSGEVKADPVTPDCSATAPLTGKIKVFFLPDFEEQYAVHPRNIMAKSDYELHFVNGWQLAAVSGDFDATAVALKLISVIDTAIGEAKKIALARLGAAGPRSTRDESAPRIVSEILKERVEVYQRVRRTYLVPGVYRINKPWEMGGSVPPGAGMLVQLGLRTICVEEWQPASVVPRPSSPPSECCPKTP